ncbi:MAG: 1,4-alpha-glucan branching enzyme, partial [Gemmatimonadetes bacterium]|nr:1,4-alpha-glucan branching enzyme [Gemmatimonadota bacterium]
MAVTERRGEIGEVRHDVSLLGEEDLHLFNEGTHSRLYRKLGAHGLESDDGEEGVVFGVWAPGAREVSVIGDFNGWEKGAHPLTARGSSGIWEGFVPGVGRGTRYKYHIVSHNAGYAVDKADPFGVRQEEPPATGSVVWELDHEWGDDAWMAERGQRNARDAPISVYEVHLGSWRRPDGTMPSYTSIAEALADYVAETGFTHVEFMPLTEHPFYGSWGY